MNADSSPFLSSNVWWTSRASGILIDPNAPPLDIRLDPNAPPLTLQLNTGACAAPAPVVTFQVNTGAQPHACPCGTINCTQHWPHTVWVGDPPDIWPCPDCQRSTAERCARHAYRFYPLVDPVPGVPAPTVPMPSLEPAPAQMGWQCPSCHACYAPHVAQCQHCRPVVVTLDRTEPTP